MFGLAPKAANNRDQSRPFPPRHVLRLIAPNLRSRLEFFYYSRTKTRRPRSDDEALTNLERAAWAAVDRALAVAEEDAAAATASDKKIFSELEGVDKAVSAACNSVIGFLLQV